MAKALTRYQLRLSQNKTRGSFSRKIISWA